MLVPSELSMSERVLIHAPFGRDGSLIEGELKAAGFSALECRSILQLCAEMREGAGAALVADEALTPAGVQALATELANQPPWSDFPLIIMTSGGAATSESRYRVQLIEPLRNVSLLERPLRPVTLVSSLRAALRASPGDELLHAAIVEAIARKPKGHDFIIDRRTNAPAVPRHMSVTGG